MQPPASTSSPRVRSTTKVRNPRDGQQRSLRRYSTSRLLAFQRPRGPLFFPFPPPPSLFSHLPLSSVCFLAVEALRRNEAVFHATRARGRWQDGQRGRIYWKAFSMIGKSLPRGGSTHVFCNVRSIAQDQRWRGCQRIVVGIPIELLIVGIVLQSQACIISLGRDLLLLNLILWSLRHWIIETVGNENRELKVAPLRRPHRFLIFHWAALLDSIKIHYSAFISE